ncbi:MBL fold metallo-hydrolase [Kordiimonas laminariae]|uniref:MBL fold metallo-hydrolase n=1 Tax=Kordiimonas laminariae TaxID=2917717 RepID=UPI001FF2F00A|nr:MBL fold metallo-hydrolase [Kordiimonas laminariae]MCK0069129.1 MBL fold metallo-hydrolase [Kordiimonas laminariae]
MKQPDFFREKSELLIDFEKRRKTMLSWRVSRTSVDLERFVFDGEKGRLYDILNRKYSDEDWLTFDSVGVSAVRASDTMIARVLPKLLTFAEHVGNGYFRGALHEMLKVRFLSGFEAILYIQQDTGFISKMERSHLRAGTLSYIFSNHIHADGIVYAQDMNFFVGDQPRQVSLDRKVTLNPSTNSAFDVPAGFTPWGEVLKTSEWKIQEVAKNTYLVGKGRSYTVFVDTGEAYIASGGQRDFRDALEKLYEYRDESKPVGSFVLTHHHSEHLADLPDVAELGATIFTVTEHLSAVKDRVGKQLKDKQIQEVNTFVSLADGQVEIYDISTAHSEHNLVMYVPQAKLLFAEDHYETQLKNALPRVHKDMINFKKAVRRLKLDVDAYLDGHSPRILTNEEFDQAIKLYGGEACPEGYNICVQG